MVTKTTKALAEICWVQVSICQCTWMGQWLFFTGVQRASTSTGGAHTDPFLPWFAAERVVGALWRLFLSCEAGWSYIGSLSESSEEQILGHCYQGQMGFLTRSLILSLCIPSTIILTWNVRMTAKLALFQSIRSFDPPIRCNSFCCVVTMIFWYIYFYLSLGFSEKHSSFLVSRSVMWGKLNKAFCAGVSWC